jgi:uncharacterized protein DUF4338
LRPTSRRKPVQLALPTGGAGAADLINDIEVQFKHPARSVPVFRAGVRAIAATGPDSESDRLERLETLTSEWREEVASAVPVRSRRKGWPLEERQHLFTALLVIADLARQGWTIELAARGAHVRLRNSAQQSDGPMAEKERIRRQELLKRLEQLAKPSVRDFIRGMEKKRLHRDSFVSVLSLLRDGRELAAALRAANLGPEARRAAALDQVVQPYLEFVDEEARCELTGLRLMDIWRYFRHTWTNQYLSVPGRTMQFLVRDAAAPLHPVIGICSLSSPIVQIRERDLFIGWHPERFIAEVRAAPSQRVARWLLDTVDHALDAVYLQDLLEEKVITVAQFRDPDVPLIKQLQLLAKDERDKHHRFMSGKELKQLLLRARGDWVRLAKTHLYRSKRAFALADLLEARRVLQRFFSGRPTKDKLASLLDDGEGAQVVARILRKAKGDRVGIVMADISVCGAVPPYNALLGGKLVAMLATSPEVIEQYRRRYGEAVSEIASGTAGRAITRRPDLVFLATTSLYGGSSQYNRISIPCERLGSQQGSVIRYHETGRSEAYGTSQFSEETVEALAALVEQSQKGQRVNSIFGEGQSPKMRKIRAGLEELGLQADPLLRHGRRRVVYCVPLIRNVRDFMIGLDAKPEFLVPQDAPRAKTDAIAQWWKERWMRPRVARPETIAAVESHTLVYPIRHGARVMLPPDEQHELALE